jgi:two-component system, NarL family, nitrate/nitrite response regulator NarL
VHKNLINRRVEQTTTVNADQSGAVVNLPIPLFLIEANQLLREGLSMLLQEGSRFEVAAASSSFAGLRPPADTTPKLVLIGGDEVGQIVATLDSIQRSYPSSRRVVLTDAQGDQLSRILNSGAHACLGRDVTVEALVMALDLALLGTRIVCRPTPVGTAASFTQIVPVHLSAESNGSADGSGHRLSSREISILECLMHGESNKLIARRFQIAEATVKVHIKAILRKIRAVNRTQAAIWAMNNLPKDHAQSSPAG